MNELAMIMKTDPKVRAKVYAIRTILLHVGYSLVYVLNHELDTLFENPKIIEQLKSDQPLDQYDGAALALHFSGRKVNKENVRALLEAAGLPIVEGSLNEVNNLKLKNVDVYLGMLFFLVMAGKPVTAENVMKLCAACGEYPDKDTANFMIDTFNEYKRRNWYA